MNDILNVKIHLNTSSKNVNICYSTSKMSFLVAIAHIKAGLVLMKVGDPRAGYRFQARISTYAKCAHLYQICTHSACQECRSHLVVVHHLHTCTRFAHILLVNNVVVVLQLFIIYSLELDLHTFCLSRMSQSSCSCSSFTHLYQICTHSACQQCRSHLVVVHHLHTCTRFAHILLVKNVVVVLQLFIIYTPVLDLHTFCLSTMSQSPCSCSSFTHLYQICTYSACQECRSRLVVVHHLFP